MIKVILGQSVYILPLSNQSPSTPWGPCILLSIEQVHILNAIFDSTILHYIPTRAKRTYIFTWILLSFQGGYILYENTICNLISIFPFQYFYGSILFYSSFFLFFLSFFSCHFSWVFVPINLLFSVLFRTMAPCLT